MRGRLGSALVAAFATAAFAAPAASADVVLNEVSCDGEDWIELINTAAAPADVSGWVLTDKSLASSSSDRLVIGTGTTIPGAGRRTFARNKPGGFSFGIGCSETIRLGDASAAHIDEVALPDIDFDLDTWGRLPEGSGPWHQTFPTPDAMNWPSPAGADQAARVFDPSRVAGIELGLPPESEAALRDPEEWQDYQDGTLTFTIDGEAHGPYDVGIRLKGSGGSFRTLDGKAAFKVRLPHTVPGQRLFGLKTLTLNNMVQDRSNVHEVMSYEAFRAVGIPAPRTGYAHVSVNGADYGLYLNVETVDEVALARWSPDTGHLYEGEYGDDVVPGGAGGFEVDEGSEGDVEDLEALIAAVNDPGAEPFSERVEAVADLRQMTLMWAVEKYIGHLDGYSSYDSPLHPNNYLLHSDGSGRFTMLPWGTDQTWMWKISFDSAFGTLIERCFGDPACALLYRDGVRRARAVISGLDLDARATSLAAQLAPWQASDPRREYTLEQTAQAVAEARAFIAERPAEAAAWLGPEEPPSEEEPPPPEKEGEEPSQGVAGTSAPQLTPLQRCKRAHPKGPQRKRCVRKAKRRAQARA